MEKVCSKCKQTKDISQFRKDKYRKDGYTNRCKVCIDNIHSCTCEQCGKLFTCSKKNQKYCSYECMGLANINKVKFNCDYCGKESEVIKSEYDRNNHHYCSRNCTDKHRSEIQKGENHPNWKGGDVETYCDFCGDLICIDIFRYNNNKSHFCSTQCLGKHKSLTNIGENNPNYNPNKTDEERIVERKYKEYSDFIKYVYERDEYTCQSCQKSKEVSGSLNVHHLNSYNWDLENRTNPDNGITLCEECHKDFHSKYGYGFNTKEQFKKWKCN